ncbi:MAG: endonuclease/exonuclease/phosphatase family protein [Bacteroidales bacterium]|nr:endonuclease/exonuclease/phosphatase family protein [Candidatus Colimorpha merdihippi]
MKKFLRFILLIINVVFVVALLLSTFAGGVPPSRFVWISILSYGYFPLVLCNVVFIIIWLSMSRWEFLVSTAAIAIRYSFLPLFFQVGGCTGVEKSEDSFKMMTFNTHSFVCETDTAITRDSAATLFLEILDEEEPDAFCLQECFGAYKINISDSLIARGYKYHYGVQGSSVNAPLILYSKFAFVNVHDMDKKSKFYVDINCFGKDIRICCVHLDSYQLDTADLRDFERISHAQIDDTSAHKLLGKFKETIRCHEKEWNEELKPLIEKTSGPIIIAGDFNDTPASYIYQQATKLLKDPYVAQGRGFGTTYHGPYPAFRIDYLLHSPSLEALSYKRVKTNISDHYPIVVQFALAHD